MPGQVYIETKLVYPSTLHRLIHAIFRCSHCIPGIHLPANCVQNVKENNYSIIHQNGMHLLHWNELIRPDVDLAVRNHCSYTEYAARVFVGRNNCRNKTWAWAVDPCVTQLSMHSSGEKMLTPNLLSTEPADYSKGIGQWSIELISH